MESVSRKRRSCESNEDRLSGLPDEVILHILSFMPTLDAVRTMLLRRFQNLWTLVPALRFDFDEYYGRMVDKPPSIHVAFTSSARFVRNVLMLHRRPTLDTFHLTIDDFHQEFRDPKINGDVQMWLRFATDEQVKHLYFRCVSYYLGPPRFVFRSQSLVTLTLSGCMIEEYEHQSQLYMGTLRKLSLICISGSTEAFNQLITGCPSLQELVIDRALVSSGLLWLDINAPSIHKLYLCMFNHHCTLNCPSLKILDFAAVETTPDFQLRVIGVITLQEVNVKLFPLIGCLGLVHTLYRLIITAELFTLSCEAFKGISCIKMSKLPRNRCKRIVLHPCWNDARVLEIIFNLIRTSVNLEKLIIYAGQSMGNYCKLFCPEWYTCVIPLLKTVTIHGNHGYEKWCKSQLQVIEFLLRNAVVLDKLVITLGKSKLTTIEELGLVKQVSTFRRASANATVIFASS